MTSYRQKGLEQVEKQRLIDEIHQKPEVKKIFTICEIYLTLNWLSNLIFFTLLIFGIMKNDLDSVTDLTNIVLILLDSIGGYAVVFIFLIIKILLGRLKKSYFVKLQVLEDAGLEEIKKQKELGTYVEGRKPNIFYRIYRGFRTFTIIAVLIIIAYLVFTKIL